MIRKWFSNFRVRAERRRAQVEARAHAERVLNAIKVRKQHEREANAALMAELQRKQGVTW